MLFAALDGLGVAYDKVYAPHLSFDFHAAAPEWKVVIERCVSQSRGYAIAASLEAWGVEVVNPSHVIANCGDKLVTNALLAKHKIPTPRTQVAFDTEKTLEMIEAIWASNNKGFHAISSSIRCNECSTNSAISVSK